MRRRVLTIALLLVLGLPSAVAAGQSTTTDRRAAPGTTTPSTESRIGGRGGSFGRRTARPRVTRSRPARPSRRRQSRRPLLGRGFLRSVLQFLGIAYLVNLLFGWGPGGSPLGLLIVLGVIVWLATRRRRRRPLYY